MFKRVVLKLSGEALANGDGGFNTQIVEQIGIQVKKILAAGVEIAIVVGGGNFWRGRSSAPFMNRNKSDQIGMLATVMNGLYLEESFTHMNIRTEVMTPFSVGAMTQVFSADLARDYLSEGRVCIMSGGTGLPFFSTDTATALRGAELQADALLFAKNGVQCVYEDDPRINPYAKSIDRLTFNDIITNDKINVMDSTAACICQENKISVIVFGMEPAENIYTAVSGEKIGTLVTI